MTPKTTTQNLALWGAALAIAVLLSFLSGIATHWPEGGSIDWRGVWLGVISTVVTTLPVVAAGFGLPRLGKEGIASLVSEVGADQAKAALEVARSAPAAVPTVAEIADELERRRAERVDERAKGTREVLRG